MNIGRVRVPRAFEGLKKRARYKAFHGGRGSGKSWSFAIELLLRGVSQRTLILCCREIQKSIKDSVKRLLDNQIEAMGLGDFYYSTRDSIVGKNGTQFIFEGLWANIESIKSKESIDIAWVEEAQSISQASLQLLIPTVRKNGSELWFSWNPKNKTDPVDVMFRGSEPPPMDEALAQYYDEWAIVKEVNYDANPFFPAILRADMEWDKRRDPGKYAWIWLGKYLSRSNARVFTNWRIGTHDEFDKFVFPWERGDGTLVTPRYGADWGFSVDPTVLTRNFIHGRTLYIDDEAYAVGCDVDLVPFLFGGVKDSDLVARNRQGFAALTEEQKRKWRGVEGARKHPIVADSARPESISYMQKHGYPLIKGARKGKGSVEDGIEFMKSFDIVVHPTRCPHTVDELTLCSYKVDPRTEEVLAALEDDHNHTIDANRYSLEDLWRNTEVGQRSVAGLY